MNGLTKAAVQGAACGLMIGAVLLVGERVRPPATVAARAMQPAAADVVRARRFEVVDAAGKARGLFGLESRGTSGLYLYDAAEKPRMGMSFSPSGEAGLILMDSAGSLRVVLSLLTDGTPGLRVRDTAGELRTVIGSGFVRLFDENGKALWVAP